MLENRCLKICLIKRSIAELRRDSFDVALFCQHAFELRALADERKNHRTSALLVMLPAHVSSTANTGSMRLLEASLGIYMISS